MALSRGGLAPLQLSAKLPCNEVLLEGLQFVHQIHKHAAKALGGWQVYALDLISNQLLVVVLLLIITDRLQNFVLYKREEQHKQRCAVGHHKIQETPEGQTTLQSVAQFTDAPGNAMPVTYELSFVAHYQDLQTCNVTFPCGPLAFWYDVVQLSAKCESALILL